MLEMYSYIERDLSIYDLFVVVQKQRFNRSYVELFGCKESAFDSLSYLALAESQAELDIWLSAKGVSDDRVINYSEYKAMLTAAKQTSEYGEYSDDCKLARR